jgi:hypothetical protein
MGQAKEIRVAPISKKDADALIKRLHYSHKITNNSSLRWAFSSTVGSKAR